jgi:hypothetical protein
MPGGKECRRRKKTPHTHQSIVQRSAQMRKHQSIESAATVAARKSVPLINPGATDHVFTIAYLSPTGTHNTYRSIFFTRAHIRLDPQSPSYSFYLPLHTPWCIWNFSCCTLCHLPASKFTPQEKNSASLAPHACPAPLVAPILPAMPLTRPRVHSPPRRDVFLSLASPPLLRPTRLARSDGVIRYLILKSRHPSSSSPPLPLLLFLFSSSSSPLPLLLFLFSSSSSLLPLLLFSSSSRHESVS